MPDEKGNSLRVLVVDDEPQVRSLVRAILSREQCDVTEARDGAQAYEMVRRRADQFDVIITDVVMPRMDGIALGRKLQSTSPDMLILYTSADATFGNEIPAVRWLRKPFTPQGLSAWVRANTVARCA